MKTPQICSTSDQNDLPSNTQHLQVGDSVDALVLVEMVLANNKMGFELLYANYSAALYGVILKMVERREVANDILQETFVKIWLHMDEFDSDRGTLFTWMLNIARNQSIDYLRSAAHRHFTTQVDIEQWAQTIEQLPLENACYSDMELEDLKTNTLLRLEEKYALVVRLIFFDGWTQFQTAELLNIPLGTVKTRTRKAIDLLKQFFMP